jgi:hypothetical protein
MPKTSNSWNEFRARYKGKGMDISEISALYKKSPLYKPKTKKTTVKKQPVSLVRTLPTVGYNDYLADYIAAQNAEFKKDFSAIGNRIRQIHGKDKGRFDAILMNQRKAQTQQEVLFNKLLDDEKELNKRHHSGTDFRTKPKASISTFKQPKIGIKQSLQQHMDITPLFSQFQHEQPYTFGNDRQLSQQQVDKWTSKARQNPADFMGQYNYDQNQQPLKELKRSPAKVPQKAFVKSNLPPNEQLQQIRLWAAS